MPKPLKIYNTLGRELQEFSPIEAGKIRFYQCGPTVYFVQHLGNMRAMVMADLVRRSLIHLGYEVKFVRNYTDVGHLVSDGDQGEDKIEKGAKREGLSPLEIAQKYIDIFEADVTELNTLEPDVKPRATEYVPGMIEMVQELLDKGFAYSTPRAIYFDISKAKDYTALSGQKLELNQEGAGHGDVEDIDNKRNAADFAVWFFKIGAHANALQYWPSPFRQPENTPADMQVDDGHGFPGWHIECSAMTKAELGETLDIHMGGVEHIPVHHANEIAQSESANGEKFVNYWIHNEHLLVNGGKMSKSDGTGYPLSEVVKQGFSPLDLRYFFLQAHYRSKQNFTWEALTAAQTAYERMKNKVRELVAQDSPANDLDNPDTSDSQPADNYREQFAQAISEDFNIPEALAVTWNLLKDESVSDADKLKTVYDFDGVLGLKLDTVTQDPHTEDISEEVQAEIQKLVDARAAARLAKDWATADRIRDELRDNYNYEVKDSAA